MKNQTAAIISVAAVLVIVVSGFAPVITALNVEYNPFVATKTATSTYSAVQTTSSPSVSYTTTVMAEQSVTTENTQPFYIGPQTLQCSYYASSSAYLNSGTDASVTFSASNGLYMYVFDSAQYSAFASSSTTSPNQAEIDDQSSGSTSFHISQSDTYYFVLWLKPGIFGCTGISPVGITSTSSSASYQTTVNYFVTQTNTQVYYVPVTTTQTFYSTSTYTTTLTSTTTKTCQVGWLQDILFGCS